MFCDKHKNNACIIISDKYNPLFLRKGGSYESFIIFKIS